MHTNVCGSVYAAVLSSLCMKDFDSESEKPARETPGTDGQQTAGVGLSWKEMKRSTAGPGVKIEQMHSRQQTSDFLEKRWKDPQPGVKMQSVGRQSFCFQLGRTRSLYISSSSSSSSSSHLFQLTSQTMGSVRFMDPEFWNSILLEPVSSHSRNLWLKLGSLSSADMETEVPNACVQFPAEVRDVDDGDHTLEGLVASDLSAKPVDGACAVGPTGSASILNVKCAVKSCGILVLRHPNRLGISENQWWMSEYVDVPQLESTICLFQFMSDQTCSGPTTFAHLIQHPEVLWWTKRPNPRTPQTSWGSCVGWRRRISRSFWNICTTFQMCALQFQMCSFITSLTFRFCSLHLSCGDCLGAQILDEDLRGKLGTSHGSSNLRQPVHGLRIRELEDQWPSKILSTITRLMPQAMRDPWQRFGQPIVIQSKVSDSFTVLMSDRCPSLVLSGLNATAAHKLWQTKFASVHTRKDQVEAVNEDGQSVGKARGLVRLTVNLAALVNY